MLHLALVSRLVSSKSWLRQPCFEAYRKIARKFLMRHLIVVLGPAFHVYRYSLARATGPFAFHGSFCFVQRERPGYPSRVVTIFYSSGLRSGQRPRRVDALSVISASASPPSASGPSPVLDVAVVWSYPPTSSGSRDHEGPSQSPTPPG